MRITTNGCVIPYRRFTFPDGQRHFQLNAPFPERDVTIEARIANADELFDVLLAKDTLDANGCSTVLNIRWLLGARMDRRINPDQPNTLQVVTRALLSAGFRKIRVLDPHSSTTTALLGSEAVYPTATVERVLQQYHPDSARIIAPDLGATDRVKRLVDGQPFRIMQGRKHRDSRTGGLSGFSVDDIGDVKGKECVIVDDICDGGGTFVGLGAILLDAGASSVDLFVTHGIFSQGTPLAGIRKIWTTDSYQPFPGGTPEAMLDDGIVVWPITMTETGRR